jgi:2,3-dihydroxyphenylpropionate 1,2-dioxygenase
MARIVLGVGASHSTLMNTHWDKVVHVERAARFRDALAEARDAIAALA